MSTDADVLSQIGFDFIVKAVRVAVGGVCYGAYLLLIAFSTAILLRRGWRDLSAMVLLTMTTVMFFGCTMFFIIDLSDIIYRFKILIIENQGQPYEDKLATADARLQGFVWSGEMLFIFLLILGDSIVIWRTWALYKNKFVAIVVPGLTWIGSVIAAFYELGCDAKFGWVLPDTRPSASSVGIESCAKADTASFSLSYSTNIICTFLIMYRVWRYRQSMKKFLDAARRKTQVEKIMILLVESGTVYLAIYTFQAVPIYGGSFNPRTVIVVQAANAIIQQAMGMYPTAIVVLVQLQKTVWDTPEMTYVISTNSRLDFAPRSGFIGSSQLEAGVGTGNGVSSDGSFTATRSKEGPIQSSDGITKIEIQRMPSSRSLVGLAE